MVINRRTFNINKDCMDATIQLIKDTVAEVNLGKSPRLSIAIFGPFDVLSMEAEYENLAEYEKFWNDLIGRPEMKRFFEKWNTLTATGGTNELWELR